MDVNKLIAENEALKRGRGQILAELTAANTKLASIYAQKPLDPVEGDLLPPIGSDVFIYFASCDKWVKHRVVGYYVWGSRFSGDNLHRVFVRVVDADGILNARLLNGVRNSDPTEGDA